MRPQKNVLDEVQQLGKEGRVDTARVVWRSDEWMVHSAWRSEHGTLSGDAWNVATTTGVLVHGFERQATAIRLAMALSRSARARRLGARINEALDGVPILRSDHTDAEVRGEAIRSVTASHRAEKRVIARLVGAAKRLPGEADAPMGGTVGATNWSDLSSLTAACKRAIELGAQLALGAGDDTVTLDPRLLKRALTHASQRAARRKCDVRVWLEPTGCTIRWDYPDGRVGGYHLRTHEIPYSERHSTRLLRVEPGKVSPPLRPELMPSVHAPGLHREGAAA